VPSRYLQTEVAKDPPCLGGFSPPDLLVKNLPAAGSGFHRFARAVEEGLLLNDDVDAIALDRSIVPLQSSLLPGIRRIIGRDFGQVIDGRYDPNNCECFEGIDPFVGAGIADLELFPLTPDSPRRVRALSTRTGG